MCSFIHNKCVHYIYIYHFFFLCQLYDIHPSCLVYTNLSLTVHSYYANESVYPSSRSGIWPHELIALFGPLSFALFISCLYV